MTMIYIRDMNWRIVLEPSRCVASSLECLRESEVLSSSEYGGHLVSEHFLDLKGHFRLTRCSMNDGILLKLPQPVHTATAEFF